MKKGFWSYIMDDKTLFMATGFAVFTSFRKEEHIMVWDERVSNLFFIKY